MQTFRLKMDDDGIGVSKEVEFTAENTAAALIVLHNEAKGRWAELWQGDEPVCRLRRDGPGDGFWCVEYVSSMIAPARPEIIQSAGRPAA